MEIAEIEYDELVKNTKDDSLLEVFDRCQRWCMEKVQIIIIHSNDGNTS